MPAILFVCRANQLRSPMAAACFQKELESRSLQGQWRVSSAGTWTTGGIPASPAAVIAAKKLGVDIGNHLSQVITSNMIREADLVIVMERGQKEALQNEFSEARDKVFLLSEVGAGLAYDVPDPVLQDSAAEVYAEIGELVHTGFERICALAQHS